MRIRVSGLRVRSPQGVERAWRAVFRCAGLSRTCLVEGLRGGWFVTLTIIGRPRDSATHYSSFPGGIRDPILLMDKILHDLKDPKLRLMDKILHDPKDPKLWELWYIPYNG